MKIRLFLICCCFSTIYFSQEKNNFSNCSSLDFNLVKEDFIDTPTCEKYKKISSDYFLCFHKPIDDIELMYIASQKCNCQQAYFDLYQFYKKLNYKLSDKSDCNRNSLLLDKLDKKTREYAIDSLMKSNIDIIEDIAVFYYYGIYVQKDKKKAIRLMKNSYTYEISDKEAENNLIDMKSSIIPCKKQ